MNAKEKAVEALKTVEDPELGLDIHTLGLIYTLEVEEGKAKIEMTFTSPMCPFGPQLIEQARQALADVGITADIEVVFSPPWKPSEEVKMLLGLA